MAKEICISSTPHETRLAILEDDQLAEIYYERENEYTLAGSVYKGRVTRVLPGMQSAFVDIGLERDAFLYVTDFLEMEDQEDTDEVERAASQGDTVRQQPALPVQVQEVRAPQTAQAQAQQPRQGRNDGGNGRDRDGRGRRGEGRAPAPEVEQLQIAPQAAQRFAVAPVEIPVVEEVIPASVAEATEQQDETDEQGARRWRGRRRRRGGKGRDEAGTSSESGRELAGVSEGSSISDSTFVEEEEEQEAPALDFEAADAGPVPVHAPVSEGNSSAPARTQAGSGGPAPFVLPGESLSKYGATIQKAAPSRLVVSELPPDTSAPPPDRTVTKPSTLVETEFAWDGRGLMPGESIARHRKAEPAPTAPSTTVDAEPSGTFADMAPMAHVIETVPAIEHVAEIEPLAEVLPAADFLEEYEEAEYEEDEAVAPIPVEFLREEAAEAEDEPFPDSVEFAQEDEPSIGGHAEGLEVELTPEGGVTAERAADKHDGQKHGTETEQEVPEDASASHNVDPLPPSGFRFKDIFGGRKKEEEAAAVAPVSPAKPAKAVSSGYAPAGGLVEEEVIEEEEYEFSPLKTHHSDEHEFEEMEEETLQQQIRSGAIGELLQEAQLESRMLIESTDEEDEEEGGIPAASGNRDRTVAPQSGRNDGRSGDRGGRGRGRGRDSRPDGRGNDARGGQEVRSEGRPSESRSGGEGRSEGRSEGRPSEPRRGPSRRTSQTSDLPIISDLLKPGQEILVQIAKEPIAKKGARITSHIALPGRFLVFMPTVSHVGVSRKIDSDEERQRLKRILVSEKGDAQGGFIVRTAAEGATEEELRADLRFLINLWADVKQRAESSKPPALIYHDLNLIERILRDQVSDNFSHIWVDSEADYERIVRFLNRFSPELVRRVKLYTKEVPLFEHFGIQDEISKALRSKVWLKSGGSIVINQTEALVAIDINTGKFVGKTARLEDTILKTNLDAIPEIVRQVRLRDLGGIIVIDFIDMDERKNRTRVLAALEEALKQDRAPTKVLQFNDFGLVAITRKRVKQSLERTLSVPCPICQATGMVKSPATVANEIYVEVRKMRKHFDGTDVLLRVHPETAKALKANNASWLTELEDLSGKNVLVKSDATLHPEQFDIQG